jgi:subtilisin family serine protease
MVLKVLSTVSGDTYDVYSGTSMSAPNVTGSLILIQEHYKT